jgi:hypothetical protein
MRAECDERHGGTWRLATALSALVLGLIGGVGWALVECGSARSTSAEVQSDFRSHESRQTAVEESLRESLERLEKSIGEQRRMIEDLWKRDRQELRPKN